METPRCRLYLITPDSLDPATFAPRLAEALEGGDVACVQLRLKNAGDDAIRRAAGACLGVCRERDVALILNDRPDLAREVGADGVHIGQRDGDYATARNTVGADRIVGVTCHDSRHLAMTAADRGADYVAFGAFFQSATKATEQRAGVDLLGWWSGLFEVPCVAIGGITADNCRPLVAAGADFLAVCSGVWDHGQGPGRAVEEFARAIRETLDDAAHA